MRVYNPALGRFLSVDPLMKEYAELTPYQFASNIPTWGNDLDGLELNTSTTYVSMPKPQPLQKPITLEEVKKTIDPSNLKGPIIWTGIVLLKNDATRVTYNTEAKQIKRTSLTDSQKRYELKVKYRPETPQPFRSMLDKTRPLELEKEKVREGENPEKTNADVTEKVGVGGKVGATLTGIGLGQSLYNIYDSDDPLNQTIIEGGAWSGAMAGGTVCAELGAYGGPIVSGVAGLAGSVVGGLVGESFFTSLTEEATGNRKRYFR